MNAFKQNSGEMIRKRGSKSHVFMGGRNLNPKNCFGKQFQIIKNSKQQNNNNNMNVDMDMSPFKQINPCEISSLQLTQMKDLTDVAMDDVRNNFSKAIEGHFDNI